MYTNYSVWEAIQQRLPPPYQSDHTTMPEEIYISLSNGNRIHLDVYLPQNAKATIILLHGVGGNGRLLSFLAIPLYKCGYEVICPDLPLYGCSEYSGTVTYPTWVKDASEMTGYYVRRGRPTFLFGLSAGGMLAYQVACKNPAVRGVLATCILDQRVREITEKTSSHPYLVKLALPAVSYMRKWLPDLKIPMKWVANMKAIVNHNNLARLLMADKKSAGASISLAFLYTMLHPELDIEPAEFFTPFILLHPEQDRWTDVSLSRVFYDKLGSEKELHMLKGAGHFPIEEEGLHLLVRNSISFIERHRREAEPGNPWEKIKLTDYENHMKSDSVRQLQVLNAMMKEQLAQYPVKSIMILGIAGGNGLEHIDPEIINHVIGVDINSDYLDACVSRYPQLSDLLEMLCLDLREDYSLLPHANLVVANLFIEYIGCACFQQVINQVKPHYVSCVIQTDTEDAFVSASPYSRVFNDLDRVHHQISAKSLIQAMEEIHYHNVSQAEVLLQNGKKLVRLDFRRL